MRFDPDLTAVCADCGRIGDGCFPPKWLLAHDGIYCPDCYSLVQKATPTTLDIEAEIVRMERDVA